MGTGAAVPSEYVHHEQGRIKRHDHEPSVRGHGKAQNPRACATNGYRYVYTDTCIGLMQLSTCFARAGVQQFMIRGYRSCLFMQVDHARWTAQVEQCRTQPSCSPASTPA
jgi:hypothetical protein